MPSTPPSLEEALLAREQQLAGILDTAMDAIISIDSGFRIQLFNRAAAEMFGHSAAEMLGQPLDRLIPPAIRAKHGSLVAGYAGHGTTARNMGKTQLLRGVRADGSEFPIEASISRAGAGPGLLMTAVVRDASQQRAVEQAREAYITAEAAHRAKTEFLSRVSHELRTPLNAVLGLTKLLRATTHERLTDAEADQLDLVLAAGERLRALIDDMLTMGSVESLVSPDTAAAAEAAEPWGTVLYVEDEPVNALLVQELLRRWPEVQVSLAKDGRSGIAMAEALQPDLILLDMHLPDLSGLQVLRILRDGESTRHLRVAALSAGGTADEVAATLAAGAAHYWTKPIDFGPFLSGMRALLPQRQGMARSS
jgi:PAS domain S-box-containing protein